MNKISRKSSVYVLLNYTNDFAKYIWNTYSKYAHTIQLKLTTPVLLC